MKWSGSTTTNNHTNQTAFRFLATDTTAVSHILRPAPYLLLIPFLAVYGYLVITGSLRHIVSEVIQQSRPLSNSVELPQTIAEQRRVEFILKMSADTRQTWTSLFQEHGTPYQHPTLTLYRQSVESACGSAEHGGSFYCPIERNIYIDLDFHKDINKQFQVSGDFAQAYVLAHEVGHHIQNLIGFSQRINAATNEFKLSEKEINQLSVKKELQADCYAGVWAFYAYRSPKELVQTEDIKAALMMASAVGDDVQQQKIHGQIEPDLFTHGTSDQRIHWFTTGFETGDVHRCNTFTDTPLSNSPTRQLRKAS